MDQALSTRRRIAAILAADMVGYTRLMEAYEEYTYRWQTRVRDEILNPVIAAHEGQVVKHTGDGFVATFDTARVAIQCALELQRSVTTLTAEQPVERRINYRMAVNVADVIVDDDDVYGDGVNVASRLQTYAEPGGLVISGSVADQLDEDLGVAIMDLGDLHLRNLTRPVRVLALRPLAAPARLVGDAEPGSEHRPSVAVLPFRMQPTGPEERYFADGMVDNIVHALATLKDLFVISRGTAFPYGGPSPSVRAVGVQLGVRYVLYGSVLRSRGHLRIGTDLLDAETGTVIRSDQHEGSVHDLFHLQEQIVVDVVKAIAPHIRERELVRALRKHPQNLTAYELVLQARDHLFRIDYESFSKARGFLQQAIVHDPDYAPAYYYTACWYNLRVAEMGSKDPDADAAAAVHYASAALARDPDDPLSLAMAGLVHAYFLREFGAAISLLDRAIAAGPSSAPAWAMSSIARGYVGDTEAAIRHGEQAVRLSPLDTYLFWHECVLAQAYYIAEQYETAVAWAQSSFERNGLMRANLRMLIASLVADGRGSEAVELARYLMRIQPDFRLGSYARRCPFPSPLVERWIGHLRAARLPE
jgi:adenylate cyclase